MIDWPFNLALGVAAVIAYAAMAYVDRDPFALRFAALAFVFTVASCTALDLVVGA